MYSSPILASLDLASGYQTVLTALFGATAAVIATSPPMYCVLSSARERFLLPAPG